jgi:hypothetical protein
MAIIRPVLILADGRDRAVAAPVGGRFNSAVPAVRAAAAANRGADFVPLQEQSHVTHKVELDGCGRNRRCRSIFRGDTDRTLTSRPRACAVV